MSMKAVLREGIMGVVGDEEKADLIMGICESVTAMAAAGKMSPIMEASDGKGDSYATLKDLLNEAYDLCRDTGDQLAETYIAITDRDIDVKTAPKFPSTDKSDDAVLEHLRNLQERMQEASAKNPKFSEGVKNIFADFDEKITTIIYKWSRFQF